MNLLEIFIKMKKADIYESLYIELTFRTNSTTIPRLKMFTTVCDDNTVVTMFMSDNEHDVLLEILFRL
jgi:hypothetical protein